MKNGLGITPLAVLLVLWTCARGPVAPEGTVEGGVSPTARPELLEALRADLEAPRSAADGGGRVRLVGSTVAAVASSVASWTFEFEAGPLGIARDGWLFFQAPPFWGWSTPQVVVPEGLGYTRVSTAARGVVLEPATLDQQLLGIQIRGRELRAGETVEIRYGDGAAGALVDRFSEARSCFYFAVDGDGDGVRSLIEEQPCIDILSGPPSRLHLTLPSTARPGSTVEVAVAVLDAVGNRVEDWSGEVELTGSVGLDGIATVVVAAGAGGVSRISAVVVEPGIHTVRGRIVGGDIVGQSNPIMVQAEAQRILWADLHGHSGLTDGTGTPRDYFRYARDVASLDVVALTDHDHWGMEPLAVHPELWEEIRRENELFHRPGRFVTLLGYEWTSWIHGHRHVLYFSDHGRIYSSVDPAYESPLQLWAALRDQEALTFAHHSAGGPVATNWRIPPDPVLEPVTEITSVHGSSEAADSVTPIYSAVPGNFVRDALDRGYRLGFVGSGDGHDGHPGLAHLGAPSGGLAAILSDELTRSGIGEAIRDRRVYATNGPRIVLSTTLAGEPMGTVLNHRQLISEYGEAGPALHVEVVGTASLQGVDVVRSGATAVTLDCQAEIHCTAEIHIRDLRASEYLYVRALQADGGAAWSSPFFVD